MKLSVVMPLSVLIVGLGTQVCYSQDTSSISRASHDLLLSIQNRLSDYTANHPEVRRTQKLVQMLEREQQTPSTDAEVRAEVVKALAKGLSDEIHYLEQAADSYTPTHPESAGRQASIELLTRDLQSLQTK